MEIPARLKATLEEERELAGSVYLTLSAFEPWLRDMRTVFFPEYTDHGREHIREVLVSAEALIRDDAWAVITPQDAATLILAVLVHDAGMYLSEDGFLALIRPESSTHLIEGFDDKPWSDLWEEFLAETSRFDERKLLSLFGDTKPIHPPPLDPREMTLRDRLLIGEFLRRHHARLGHEIALWGVPGPTTRRLKFVGVRHEIAKLAGFVARSHGLPLRACIELLQPQKRRMTDWVHVPFLMVLVRIADCLHIRSERAPKEALKVYSLRSHLSRAEWKVHHAIEEIVPYQDDPEAIYIYTQPANAETLLKLKNLLENIQAELDTAWAVLGEIYGRFGDLSKLGLAIRRLNSDLDSADASDRRLDSLLGRPNARDFRSERATLDEYVKAKLKAEELKEALDSTKKHYAFLSIDVVASTKMSMGVDEYLVSYAFLQYNALLGEILERKNCFKVTTTPDGIMAAFRSEDAARAAAQELLQLLDGFNKDREKNPLRSPFKVRCGAHCGNVAIGDEDLDKVKHLVLDVAAHMQKAATPNTLWVSEEFHKCLRYKAGFRRLARKRIDGMAVYQWTRVSKGQHPKRANRSQA